MKKKDDQWPFLSEWLKKTYLIMRLTGFLCLVCVLHLSAAVDAQTERISLEVNDLPVNQALRLLGKELKKDFFYSDIQIDKNSRVSFKLSEASIEEALQKIFPDKFVHYEVQDDYVLILAVTNPGKQQQTISVSGIVRDENNEPLPGVTIQIKGTQTGIISNIEGRFQLTLPIDLPITLTFSFLGYKKQEIVIKESGQTLNIKMVQEIAEIDDVVVTGYANIRKSGFTGSSTSVSRQEILQVNSNNLISALQAFDPSLRIAPNNEMGSDPNTMPELYIRGRSGLSGVSELDALQSEDVSQYSLVNNPNQPLFIMDGYEVPLSTVYDMDINRIESINILKDAAATAMYGSRASNGVIVIETVAPQIGELRISYNLTTALTAPDLSDYNLMNAKEKVEADVAAGLIDIENPKNGFISDYYNRLDYYNNLTRNIAQGVDTYWLSKPLQTQFNHRHSLYLEGGENSIRFGLGLNYDAQNGVMKKSYRNRIGADFKVDYRLKGILQVTNQVSFNITRSKNSPYGNFGDYTKQLPYFSPYDLETGELLKNIPGGYGASSPSNPLYEATVGNIDKSEYKQIRENFTVNAFFLKNFQFRAQFALTYQWDKGEKFLSPTSSTYSVFSTNDLFELGRLTTSQSESFNWNMNLLLIYTNALNGHNLNFSMGVNTTENISNSGSSNYQGFPSAQLHEKKYAKHIIAESVSDKHTRLFGAFLSGNYTYRDIYLADISVRLDGSSEFGNDKRFAPFWSLGVGINLHKYDFMSTVTWLKQARIKATYGETGKNNFPPYAARHTYQLMLDYWFPTGIGAQIHSMGNNKLKWEKANTFNIGFDLDIWGRLNLEFNWYDKRTNNLITNMTIPSSTGFKSFRENVGEIMNRGYEINLNIAAIKQKDLNLNVILRGAHNKNEIVKISDAMKEYNDRVDAYYADYAKNSTTQKDQKYARPITKYVEGGSESAIFGMKSLGISPATGNELYVNRDGSVSYTWNAAEQVIIGNTEPKLNGSVALNLRYKKWSLYTTFLYNWGSDQYNSTLVGMVENVDVWARNVDKRVMSMRWQKPGDIAQLKSIKDRYNITRPTSRFVQKDNNLSFNSFSMSYDMDRNMVRKIGLSMLRLQFSMNDVAYMSTIKRERGLSYPFARTFNFSLNASF